MNKNEIEILSEKFDESALVIRHAAKKRDIFENYASVSHDQALVKAAREAIGAYREYSSVINDIALVFLRSEDKSG